MDSPGQRRRPAQFDRRRDTEVGKGTPYVDGLQVGQAAWIMRGRGSRLAATPHSVRGSFDSQSVVGDALGEIANRKDEGGVIRLGRADAVHQQVAAVRLYDDLEPLDAVEEIGHLFVAVSRVNLNPPVPQAILRFLAGTALLLEPVRIERPLLFLVVSAMVVSSGRGWPPGRPGWMPASRAPPLGRTS